MFILIVYVLRLKLFHFCWSRKYIQQQNRELYYCFYWLLTNVCVK